VAGASGTAAGQETGTSSGGGGSVEVDLVDYSFDPGTDSPLTIPPGTTVNFVWKTGGHDIFVDSQPDGANWEGHETIEDAGFETSHTFQTEGKYHFWCRPHKSLGMVGDIEVKKGAPLPGQGGGGGGGGGGQPAIPDSAKSLGIATSVAMAATLGLAYLFLRYGGGPSDADVE